MKFTITKLLIALSSILFVCSCAGQENEQGSDEYVLPSDAQIQIKKFIELDKISIEGSDSDEDLMRLNYRLNRVLNEFGNNLTVMFGDSKLASPKAFRATLGLCIAQINKSYPNLDSKYRKMIKDIIEPLRIDLKIESDKGMMEDYVNGVPMETIMNNLLESTKDK